MAAQRELHQLKVLLLSTPSVVKKTLTEPKESLVIAIGELALNLLYNENLETVKLKLKKFV